MSRTLASWHKRYLAAHSLPGIKIPTTGVKFYKHDEIIPEPIQDLEPTGLTLTSCQANKQASLGDAVCLTARNIGCVAAAISLGLVDERQDQPLGESTVYTDIMKEQSGRGDEFAPPTPADFTSGVVYACADAGRRDFALFGKEDSGRFKDVETSATAVSEMTAIQPAVMKGVFLYSPEYDDLDVVPDLVVLSVRPVELTRLIQGYWYETGQRIEASMGGLRMINSDLIARPYLTQEINVSPYCLGARLIAQYGPDRMGVGIPFDKFQMVVKGMEASQTGYPFQLYPGADESA